MRDAYFDFGTVALGAVSGTKVYCPNPQDTGALTTGTRFTKKHTGADCPLRIVGQNEAAMESIDSFCMFTCDDADNSGTYTETGRSEVSALGAAAYTRMFLPIPDHYRYLNVGFIGTSTGTLTTKNCSAWIEEGPAVSVAKL